MIYAIHKVTKEHSVASNAKVGESPGFHNSSFDRFRYVEATPDGWIEWHGGECPLPDKHPVELRFRTGDTTRSRVSGPWSWSHNSNALPIIAYRPILSADTKPEPHAWDGESWPPPIGTVLESFATGCRAVEAEVLAVRKGYVIGCATESALPGFLMRDQCRPIRSEEDRAVEEMMDVSERSAPAEKLCRALYRAGYRK